MFDCPITSLSFYSTFRQVCSFLLRQRNLPPVLLRVLLGHHPLPCWTTVSQALGEGAGRSPPNRSFPLVLKTRKVTSSSSRPRSLSSPLSPLVVLPSKLNSSSFLPRSAPKMRLLPTTPSPHFCLGGVAEEVFSPFTLSRQFDAASSARVSR